MWLRLALKKYIIKDSAWLLTVLGLLLFVACQPADESSADKLNSLSYAFHYRSLDSTAYYARQIPSDAEALNNLAFVSISRMRYDEAEQLLDSVTKLTDNQIELLVSYVQQMRLCQRRSYNRDFYDYRERALKAIKRIDEERSQLTERQRRRLDYAESEFAIVTSTYYYYVGLEQKSVDALLECSSIVERDTAQWLNYLYNIGAGGIIQGGTQADVYQQEFDCLIRCLLMARQYDYPYFEANALEALAEHFLQPDNRERLMKDNPSSMRYITYDNVSENELPAQLANEALRIFQELGDVYQTAGAYRTLAACSRVQANYSEALFYLEQALSDTLINQAPDLVASIREELSVVYAAIDDKYNSDLNRNLYLDLQEQTRQDRSLEARAFQLEDAVSRLNVLLIGIIIILILSLVVLRVLYVFYKRREQRREQIDELDELQEELEERYAVCKQKKRDGERRNLEQRAKVSMVNAITPLIDRMLHDVKALVKMPATDDKGSREVADQRLQYICELVEQIDSQNHVLTEWIQLRQGDLSLHIETFPLQPLFELIEKGQRSFALKGLSLSIVPTTACVKADRVLTIFMLNTIADNARKFTPEGGSVTISAKEESNFVEISVTDTGKGMSADDAAHLFDRKPFTVQSNHGFGLLNCKGIIEKYRKTSRIFDVCRLDVESRLGEGSRFFFRLPKGLSCLLAALSFSVSALANGEQPSEDYNIESTRSEVILQMVSNYADSAYFSNIAGTFDRTILFADSSLHYLNVYYRQKVKNGTDTLTLFDPSLASIPEIVWLHSGVPVNYDILLSVRNEVAVASLALHEWHLYNFNNRIYTSLFKEMSADTTLDDYCRRMQQLKSNMTIAIMLMVLLLLVLVIAIVWQIVHMTGKRAVLYQKRQDNLEMLGDEIRRVAAEEERLHIVNQVLENCLSALKHETMYYPSRIRQLVDTRQIEALPEVVGYYRELYGLLSEQANMQLQSVRLNLSRLDHDILGDENMIGYLFDIIRRQHPSKKIEVEYCQKDDVYMECRVAMPSSVDIGFDSCIEHIPYLLCKQIVRDHSEATGRRACGIWTEPAENKTDIVIILPRYLCRTSK